MATLQERRPGYHARAGLEPGTSRFSTRRLNHYAARGIKYVQPDTDGGSASSLVWSCTAAASSLHCVLYCVRWRLNRARPAAKLYPSLASSLHCVLYCVEPGPVFDYFEWAEERSKSLRQQLHWGQARFAAKAYRNSFAQGLWRLH
jgi:hypothetical protein